jgi:hypothetical protein
MCLSSSLAELVLFFQDQAIGNKKGCIVEPNEILNLPAGKKINQLVWWMVFDMSPTPHNNDMNFLPDYSGDMNAAWMVVEKLCNETGCDVVKVCKRDPEVRGNWSCNFGRGFEAFGETAPLAICRAALLAVMPG